MDVDGGKVGSKSGGGAGRWMGISLRAASWLPCLRLARPRHHLLSTTTHPHAHPTLPSLQATVYVYELVEGQVKVDKLEFLKPQRAGGGGGARTL
jgi:hypothetical protein